MGGDRRRGRGCCRRISLGSIEGHNSGIDTTDYLVAAAAASIGARLVTLNVGYYPMFEGLEPAYR